MAAGKKGRNRDLRKNTEGAHSRPSPTGLGPKQLRPRAWKLEKLVILKTCRALSLNTAMDKGMKQIFYLQKSWIAQEGIVIDIAQSRY